MEELKSNVHQYTNLLNSQMSESSNKLEEMGQLVDGAVDELYKRLDIKDLKNSVNQTGDKLDGMNEELKEARQTLEQTAQSIDNKVSNQSENLTDGLNQL